MSGSKRPGRGGVWIGALVAIATLMTLASCNWLNIPFDPCPDTPYAESGGQLDGRWDVVTVNGRPLPYESTVRPGEQFIAGTLDFRTDNFERGEKCSDLKKTYGVVTGYTLSNPPGQGTISKRGTARFFRDHTTGKTQLFAAGYVLDITFVTGTGRMIASSQNIKQDPDNPAFLPYLGPTLNLVLIESRPGVSEGGTFAPPANKIPATTVCLAGERSC